MSHMHKHQIQEALLEGWFSSQPFWHKNHYAGMDIYKRKEGKKDVWQNVPTKCNNLTIPEFEVMGA